MKTTIHTITILVLVTSLAFAGGKTLQQLDTAEDLARFINQETQTEELNQFMKSLDSNRSITVSNSDVTIPVKEIYATIIEEIIGGFDWIKEHRKVREICSFTDSNGQFYRYHIIQHTQDDYKSIKAELTRK